MNKPKSSGPNSEKKEIHTEKNIVNGQIFTRQTKDTIVAVRLPKGLLDELKDLQKINHFMDTSDEIRFVIRKYCVNPFQTPAHTEEKQQMITRLKDMIKSLEEEK